MAKRSIRNQAIRGRRRKKRLLQSLAGFFICALLIFGLSWLSGISALTIENVQIQGTQGVNDAGLIEIAEGQLAGDHWGLFSKRNVLLYPEDRIRENILKTYPRVSKANFERQNWNTLLIQTNEYQPRYTWCASRQNSSENMAPQSKRPATSSRENISKKEANGCYFLEENGYIFARADKNSSQYLNLFGNLSSRGSSQTSQSSTTGRNSTNSQRVIGKYFLDRDAWEKLTHVLEALRDIQLDPKNVASNAGGDITITTDYGPRIRISTSRPASETIEDLKAALGAEKFQGVGGRENLKAVSYFDVRFDDKVFYRATTSSTTTEERER